MLVIVAVLLSGCGNRIQNKEKVQEAIINRLQSRSGLDLNSLDISTTSVTFNKNMAYATVAFHPKGDTSLNGGMTMKYTLEARDGKWVVLNVANSQGHGPMGSSSMGMRSGSGNGAALPPGHPPVDGAANPHASPLSAQGDTGSTQ